MDDAFANRRHGGVNVGVVVFRGSNHMVFFDPPDDKSGASFADLPLLPDGEEGDVCRGCIGDPRMPSRLLHHSESLG